MEYDYFPGCSLKSYAKDLEKYSLAIAEKLGIKLRELEKWNCCGVMFPMAKDDIMRKIGAVRNLLRMKGDDLVIICPMCYNTMLRVHNHMKEDEDARSRVINYLKDDEGFENYPMSVKIHHFIEILAKTMREKNFNLPPKGIKVAAYYGCTLLRPDEVAVDDPEDPSIMEEILARFGFEPVEWWMRNECCGAYHSTVREEFVKERVKEIAEDAKANGAEIILTLCPLCHYNLKKQDVLPVEYMPKFIYENMGGMKNE